MDFTPDSLFDYSDDALLDEIRRVAGLITSPHITRMAFDRLARASSSSICRRFGGWHQALRRAGLSNRYSGAVVSHRMRTGCGHRYSDSDMLAELRRVADELGLTSFTVRQYNAHGRIHSTSIVRTFGSWHAAIVRANLVPGRGSKRYSDEEFFENILAVWTHHGRQPRYREMDREPSRITSGAYARKFEGWRRALSAFVERVNADRQLDSILPSPPKPDAALDPEMTTKRPRRTISLGLRYDVLRRDRFKCVLCGASPAVTPTCQLHVDHIIAFVRGGVTEEGNLRTLCSHCNVGKGDKLEESAV